jgi:hypothetical protein
MTAIADTGSQIDPRLGLAAILVCLALGLAWLTGYLAHTCVHTCSYGCGDPTDECGKPCPQCAADEAEQDAWANAHAHLNPEERLLGVVRLSHEQSQRRRAIDVNDQETA